MNLIRNVTAFIIGFFGPSLLVALPLLAAGPQLTAPTPNIVLQRGDNGKADLQFVVNSDADSVMVTLSHPGKEQPVFQQVVPTGETKGNFAQVPGGLYDLCVRPLNTSPGTAEDCRRVGVGEVFLVAGQSNAVSTDLSGKRHASATGLVSVNDYHGDRADVKPKSAEPVIDQMVFTKGDDGITANVCWTRLGDLIVEKYKIPVEFVNVARDATNTDDWRPVDGKCWTLFAKVLSEGTYRAILWHQGESDVMYGFPMEKSLNNMTSLIEATRLIAPHTPWIVAHNSLKDKTPYAQQPVRQAQTALVARGLACAGPDTDVIRENPDWVGVADFGEEGLTRHGELWFPIVDAFLRDGQCLDAFGNQ